MHLQLFRHATMQLSLPEGTLLIDPMLSAPGALDPVPHSPNPRANPLVPLPLLPDEIVKSSDACLVTHLHRDHFDAAAAQLLPKELPIFSPPFAAAALQEQGFKSVHTAAPQARWKQLTFTLTSGQHGLGDIGRQMGAVAGFVLTGPARPSIYLAGDTVWCPEVSETLATHQPDIIILYGGGARFTHAGPITMTETDILTVCRHAPQARIIVVHMEAFDHCLLSRKQLRLALEAAGANALVPNDGDIIQLD